MNKDGPVIIIEDDSDDRSFFKEAYAELGYNNKLLVFNDGNGLLNFLTNTDIIPFIIISDINMPKMDGFELRDTIKSDALLRLKCIPYLFFTTASQENVVIEAYSLSVQGFFIKPNSIKDLILTISSLMEYWKRCVSPNNFKG